MDDRVQSSDNLVSFVSSVCYGAKYDDRQICKVGHFVSPTNRRAWSSIWDGYMLLHLSIKIPPVNWKETGNHSIFLGPIFLHGHSD